MRQASIDESVRDMLARHPGIRGCALVETGSGLVWYRHPDADMGGVWEASVEYWRLHCRLDGHFESLGDLGAVVTYHLAGTLAMIPCLRDPDVLLVCIAERSQVDWVAWQRDVRELGARIAPLL